MTILKYYTLAFLLYVIFLSYYNILANGLTFSKRINKRIHQNTNLSNVNDIEVKDDDAHNVHLSVLANKSNKHVDSRNSDSMLDIYYNTNREKSINEKLTGMESVAYVSTKKHNINNSNVNNNRNAYSDNIGGKSKGRTLKAIERNAFDDPKNENGIHNNFNPSDVYFQSFNLYKKPKYTHLNNQFIKSSNIELKNKLNSSINPVLSLVASKTVDGILGKVNQHMQGPIALNSNGNNSPLANPIVTPNLYANGASLVGGTPNIPNNYAPPVNAQLVGSKTPLPNNFAPPNQVNNAPNQVNYTPANTPLISANSSNISQNPAFNIHPTASNLRGDPGNVSYNEVISVTMGIVLSLILFCFVSGCIIKMCKPKKRR